MLTGQVHILQYPLHLRLLNDVFDHTWICQAANTKAAFFDRDGEIDSSMAAVPFPRAQRFAECLLIRITHREAVKYHRLSYMTV